MTTGSDETRAEFEAVALPFLKTLYGAAVRWVQNVDDASDLVQETYLRAYRTFLNFKRGTNCKAWLFSIMYSVWVNRYRKEKREPNMVAFDDVEEKFRHAMSDKGTVFSSTDVDQALRALPESFRLAVVLVDIEELSYEDAATVMKCPVGTLRSRLFRGRKMLFLELQDYARRLGYTRGSKG